MVLRNQKLKELAAEKKSHPEKRICHWSQSRIWELGSWRLSLFDSTVKDDEEGGSKHIYITNINRNINDFIEYADNKSSSIHNSYSDKESAEKVTNKETGYQNIYMSQPEDFYRKLSHTLRQKAEESYKQSHPSRILNILSKYDKIGLTNLAAGILPQDEEAEAEPQEQEPKQEASSSTSKFQPAQKLQAKKETVKMLSSKSSTGSAVKAPETFISAKSDDHEDYHEDEWDLEDW